MGKWGCWTPSFLPLQVLGNARRRPQERALVRGACWSKCKPERTLEVQQTRKGPTDLCPALSSPTSQRRAGGF